MLLVKKYLMILIDIEYRKVVEEMSEFVKAVKELGGGAVAYAWFIWQKGYKGETILKWIN